MNDKQRLRKKKARQQRIKTKLARRRKAKHYEDKRKKELWEINRTSEKEMLGATYRKPKEISENTQD